MKRLNSKTCEEIMTTSYKPTEFVVGGLIAQGLYILAGAPKVGKSWLALDMCLSIAKGEKVIGRETLSGTALYHCLEDSYVRIQNRLYEITDTPTEKLYFSWINVNKVDKKMRKKVHAKLISDSNLRLLVEKITVHQNEDKSIDVNLEFNGNFDSKVIE